MDSQTIPGLVVLVSLFLFGWYVHLCLEIDYHKELPSFSQLWKLLLKKEATFAEMFKAAKSISSVRPYWKQRTEVGGGHGTNYSHYVSGECEIVGTIRDFKIIRKRYRLHLEKRLTNVKNYTDLLKLAFEEIEYINPEGVSMIIAPISTGGNRMRKNLKTLEAKVMDELSKGRKIFNQIPYLDMNIKQFAKIRQYDTEEKFAQFFLPLLESGKIKSIIPAPGWEKSKGCQWEYHQAKRLEIEIIGS